MDTKQVYKAITAITAAMSKEGISKAQRNTQGSGYNFRGIDDVLNALSGLLAQHQLCILPRVVKREQVERQSKQGGALFYTAVEVEFDLVSAVDGSMHTARMCGEAMDSGDKSTNKAMSAAYKYMALQAFCIPTEGDNDADAHSHEVAGRDAKLTVQQIETINQTATEKGVKTANILKHYKAKTFADIPASTYNEILDGLKAA